VPQELLVRVVEVRAQNERKGEGGKAPKTSGGGMTNGGKQEKQT